MAEQIQGRLIRLRKKKRKKKKPRKRKKRELLSFRKKKKGWGFTFGFDTEHDGGAQALEVLTGTHCLEDIKEKKFFFIMY